MSRLPYPGLYTQKELINQEAAIFKSPTNFVHFEFTPILFQQIKIVKRIPKGSLVGSYIQGYVLTAFDGGSVYLNIGTEDDPESIFRIPISISGPQVGVYAGRDNVNYMKIFALDTNIVISIVGNREDQLKPTQGEGWCMFHWFDMNRVDGYG